MPGIIRLNRWYRECRFAAVPEVEVLPVPPELLPSVWKSARRVGFSRIPNYNIERTHTRLLAGVDQLWLAYGEPRCGHRLLLGVIVTSISNRPPQQRKAFKRSDPKLMKSLTIHLAGEYSPLSWLDSAVERIGLYARQHGCHMLFILARRGWHFMLYHRWYSREWEVVALGRDRPTASKCKRLAARNTPGYFRPLVPIPPEKWNRYYYAFMSTCYFKAAA